MGHSSLALLDKDDADAGSGGAGADNRPRLPRVRELERTSDRVLLEVTAPSNLYYFDGHFDVAWEDGGPGRQL